MKTRDQELSETHPTFEILRKDTWVIAIQSFPVNKILFENISLNGHNSIIIGSKYKSKESFEN